MRTDLESTIQKLCRHAWDDEIQWPQVERWLNNFQGEVVDREDEQLYALYALSRFMYFGRSLVREMLRSLYRDYFEAPMKQRLRRANNNTRDVLLLDNLYRDELHSTRFLGVGNPAESGAHLLYYFRQENQLSKNLFADLSSAFEPQARNGQTVGFVPRDTKIKRYVFFDDLVGSGTQVSQYLSGCLPSIRAEAPDVELIYMCLFGTKKGMERANEVDLFNGNAQCLFFLDDSYKAFEKTSRYFKSPPKWFNHDIMRRIAEHYGAKLSVHDPLGYRDGQLLLSFSHNTPDNAPPIFWDENFYVQWAPVFLRYTKNYQKI
ncbi:hypothetical protein CLU93_1277 [Janthinobacterium sp. 35]|uniref:phosphoribosyltransferase-like protein n=1 Tax=Janthinobacterium sp. 35 TaxID=2035210 RepID=UPI000C175979|nr:hypothetical protein [Janthinobacterium sp. 35]PIG27052.1 hypothetical protein CLU93_1277 [Janthinobacterium sp. 35]